VLDEALTEGLLTDEVVPEFLRSYSARSRRRTYLKTVLVLMLILLGLYLMYQHYQDRFSTGLFRNGLSSGGQTSPKAALQNKADEAFRGGQLSAEGKTEEAVTGSLSPLTKLQGSALPLEERKQEMVAASSFNQLPPPVDQQSSKSTNRRSPPVSLVNVSDVSGQASPPNLRRSSRIEIPASVARSITKPLFVRLELNPAGKVVGMQMVNEGEENTALATIVTAAVPEWEFTSMESSSTETIVKYFCFRVRTEGEPARAGKEQNQRSE
jgi:hypothetical protein